MRDARLIILQNTTEKTTKLKLVDAENWPQILAALPEPTRNWATTQGFTASSGSFLSVPDKEGRIAQVLVGYSPQDDGFTLARLAKSLPPGTYEIAAGANEAVAEAKACPPFLELAWALETYRFDRYSSKAEQAPNQLVANPACNYEETIAAITAIAMVRDLINTPANDCGPQELQHAAQALAETFNARLNVTIGEALQQQFPLVHAVGQASPRPPRVIDLHWGAADAPKVTLVGKGVVFDTGGLDIKPASGMALMKKDMGGAANVLGLAHMVMAANLPVRLRVIIPAVENAIAGNAFRPGDVLKSRKGLTVEIGNTDAEGRLILADALALADEETPDLLIDMATLTGAARVALGPDLPPFFTNDEALAADIQLHATSQKDPTWRLPLWQPYNNLFESNIADLNNSSDSGFAGSITAALFLQRFVSNTQAYVHFDVYGWQPGAKPGHPKGGEAQVIRALYALIKTRFAKTLA